MGPARKRYWLPLGQLSAFFAAVVLAGNFVLYAVAPLPTESTSVKPRGDFYSRKKKKIERHLRALERFFDGGFAAPEPPPEPAPPKSGAEHRSEPLTPNETGAMRLPEPVVAFVDPAPAASVEPTLAEFLWPVLPDPVPAREIDLLPSLEAFPSPAEMPDLLLEWSALGAGGIFADMADSLLKGPEAILDGTLALGSAIFPRSGNYVWGMDEDEGITARLLDLTVMPRQGRIFSELLGRWMEREQRFFAGIGDSYLNSFAFEDGTAEMDLDELMDEQRKILWDTVRKTYFSKYKLKAEERIRDDAFYFPEWRGVDFVVLPPLMAGYLFYRGLDKKISMGPTYLRVNLEPVAEWLEDNELLIAGLSLEWGIKGFPVGLIASAGLYEGDVQMDFVGVGTSVSMVRKALLIQHGF